MLKSLYLYTRFFGRSFLSGWRRNFLLHDLERYRKIDFRDVPSAGKEKREDAIHRAAEWLLRAQQMMADDGFGSWHMVDGWSASYPETSGYIIPSLLNYSESFNKEEIKPALIKSADWLVSIQKENGGWQGGRIGENKPAIVFNTAQIIRGLLAIHQLTGIRLYLDSSVRAADWLCEVQEEEGFWKKNALMNTARVYDSYVDVPLAQMWKVTGDKKYRTCAEKNLEWIIRKKQKANGWFYDCDNTVKRNDKPILHTIAYTIDGLIDCGEYFQNNDYISAAEKAAGVLRDKFSEKGYLNGRYDENWNGSEYILTTGCAQMAINWMKLYALKGNAAYKAAADQMIDLLVFIIDRGNYDTADTKGALPGSFPVWGKYEPFAFPNWGTKYLLDALLMNKKLQDEK